MTHKNVFEVFNKMFPGWRGMSETWYPYGNATIKIRMRNKSEYVFAYFNDRHWKLETIESFGKKERRR